MATMEEKISRIEDEVRGCACAGAWEQPLDSFLDPLQKYRLRPHPRCEGCALPVGLMEEHVHILARISPPRCGQALAREYGSLRRRLGGMCRCGVKKVLKAQTGLMKMGGANISPYWRQFCYWELAYGYVPYRTIGEMEAAARTWLGEDLVLGGPLGEERYMALLWEEVTRLFTEEWHRPEKTPTIEEWVKTGRWMKGRGGTGGKTAVEVDGKRLISRRMKAVEGVLCSDANVAAGLVRPVRERMVVMQKSEGGKIRPVVKTGDDVNRKMNFLSEWVERGFFGCKLSTLFAGEKGNEEIDLDLIDAVRDASSWKVPLDQGGFDQHQSKYSIAVVLHAMGVFLRGRDLGDEFGAVWASLWDSLFLAGAQVEVGDVVFEWVNGLPSGWRWTAILDTILNIASFRVVVRIAESRLGSWIPIQHHYAQGDDVIFSTGDLRAVALIIDTFGKLGYEVHPEKTYISRDRAEFLRRSYEWFGVTGYTARTLVGIRFRNPVQAEPLVAAERLYAHLNQWYLAALRGGVPAVCGECYLEDASGDGVDVADAADFAVTPSAVGGAGLDIHSEMGQRLASAGRGRWLTLVTRKEARSVQLGLGAWKDRLADIGWGPQGSQRWELERALAASWGIRESDLVGRVDYWFEEVEKREGRPPEAVNLVPDASKLWDLESVPVQLRGGYQRSLVEQGVEEERLVPGAAVTVKRWRGRMSRRVYAGWLLGAFQVPTPLVETVGPRYGSGVKQWGKLMLRAVLSAPNISLKGVETGCLWLEKRMSSELRAIGLRYLLAQ